MTTRTKQVSRLTTRRLRPATESRRRHPTPVTRLTGAAVAAALVASACSGGGQADTTVISDESSATTTSVATTTPQDLGDIVPADTLGYSWDGNPATLPSPIEVLDGFRYEMTVMNTNEQDGLLVSGVFVAPDATECTLDNPVFSSPGPPAPSGRGGPVISRVSDVGRIVAAGNSAWVDDGVSTPFQSDRFNPFIVEGLGLCPGSREFWEAPLFTQFPFQYEVEGTGEPIGGYETTRARVVSIDPDVAVTDGFLWLSDGGWPIRLRVVGTMTGGVWAALGKPFTLGDDPVLDRWWSACDDGDLALCDLLYTDSPNPSAYEFFGGTCGLRFEPATGTTCVDNDPLLHDEPYTLGDDDGLDALWEQCTTGDPDACDELFDSSPVNSAYEIFGETCGMLIYTDLYPCKDILAEASSTTAFEFELLLSDIDSPELGVVAPNGGLLAGSETAVESQPPSLSAAEKRAAFIRRLEAEGWMRHESEAGWSIMYPRDWRVTSSDDGGLGLLTSGENPNGFLVTLELPFTLGLTGSREYMIADGQAGVDEGLIRPFDPSTWFELDFNFDGVTGNLDIYGIELELATDPATGDAIPDGASAPIWWYTYHDPDARPATAFTFQMFGTDPLGYGLVDTVVGSFEPPDGIPPSEAEPGSVFQPIEEPLE